MATTRLDLGRGAWIDYDPAWLAPDEADALLAELCAALPWTHRPIVVAGREVPQPRLLAWGGALPYRYSGQTLEPAPLHPTLAALMARAAEACGVPFNHAMANRYRDGRDSIGMHADRERELGRDPTIAAISLGARRRFVLERKRGRRARRNLRPAHGSLLVMGGSCQHTWYHGLPRDPACDTERVNVTFRWLLGPPGTVEWAAPAEGNTLAP
ncbi:MAG: alpha-ketoglutarate-dependent dioxygenase AlkB [Myxococcota bacterium]